MAMYVHGLEDFPISCEIFVGDLEISPTHKIVSFIFSLVETISFAPALNGEASRIFSFTPTHKMVSFIFSLVETISFAPTTNGETSGFAYFVNEKILSMTLLILWKSPTWR